jgi:branched-chain amino acid transport system permease protein
MLYFIELVIRAALAGSLYGLVALAFVVVYKATRFVNFALGELVVFAIGFVTVGLHKLGLGLLDALGFVRVSMTGLALAFKDGVRRQLIGRPLLPSLW